MKSSQMPSFAKYHLFKAKGNCPPLKGSLKQGMVLRACQYSSNPGREEIQSGLLIPLNLAYNGDAPRC